MSSSNVIYPELFIALFFLPGFFITVILGIKKLRFLLSFALSYSLLVLTLLPFEYFGRPIIQWQWCILLAWIVLAVLAVAKIFMYGNSNQSRQPGAVAAKPVAAPLCWGAGNLFRRFLSPRLIIPLVLTATVCGYLAYAGPYLEVPSDTWGHVFKFQLQKLALIFHVKNEKYQPSASTRPVAYLP